nr:MAG: hypothetical protein [Bacteriophage sp.]
MSKRVFKGVYYAIKTRAKGFIPNNRYVGLINWGRTQVLCENFTQIKCENDDKAISIAKMFHSDEIIKRAYDLSGRLIMEEHIYKK